MTAVVVSLLLALAHDAAALQSTTGLSDDAVVRSLCPARLTAHSRSVGRHLPPEASFVAIQTAGGRRLVAAYSNGHGGAVCLIEPVGAGRVVDTVFDLGMVGTRTAVRVENVVPGAPPEIVATFCSPQADRVDWLFSVDATALRPVGPLEKFGDVTLSGIVNARYLDVDRDGVVEIFNGPVRVLDEDGNVVGYEQELVTISPSGATEATPLAFYGKFLRGTAQPVVESKEFVSGIRDAVLLLANGPDGSTPCTAGWAKLNGDLVVKPSDLKKGVSRTEVPVQLQRNNVFEVELAGEPGCGIVAYVARR